MVKNQINLLTIFMLIIYLINQLTLTHFRFLVMRWKETLEIRHANWKRQGNSKMGVYPPAGIKKKKIQKVYVEGLTISVRSGNSIIDTVISFSCIDNTLFNEACDYVYLPSIFKIFLQLIQKKRNVALTFSRNAGDTPTDATLPIEISNEQLKNAMNQKGSYVLHISI